MARLNTRDSSSVAGRSALSSIGSRANTPSTGAINKKRAATPGSGSEKENPPTRLDKGKAPIGPSAVVGRTQTVEEHSTRMAKRRRSAIDDAQELEEEEDDDDLSDISPSSSVDDPDALLDVTEGQANDSGVNLGNGAAGTNKRVRIFDPNQDEGERRAVKTKSRALEREFMENRDDYMRADNDGLARVIERADENFRQIKQSCDGTTDSRLMVSVSDVAHRRSARMMAADGATGIDLDDYVSKCIALMRRGANEATQNGASGTQRRRTRNDDEDEVGDEWLDWAYLGRRACQPHNIRPAVTAFLLGPLSVHKRVRAPTQRRARQRDDARAEARPEALQRADLETNETSTVRHVCGKIKNRLVQHCERSEARVQAIVADMDEETLTDIQIARIMRKERITRVGGPSLFDFCVNPQSFGQTVENLFYVSFLIKEGEVGVQMDENGLPALVPNQESASEARERHRAKHQAVFSIDHETWGKLKEAYGITHSLIPHRQETERRVGARGWYS